MLSYRKMKSDKPTLTTNSEPVKKLPKVKAGNILSKTPSLSQSANPPQLSRVKSPTDSNVSSSSAPPRVSSPSILLPASGAPKVKAMSTVSAASTNSRARVDQKNILRPTNGFNLTFGASNLARRASSRASSSGNNSITSPHQRSQSVLSPRAPARFSLPSSVKKILDDFNTPIPIDDSEDSDNSDASSIVSTDSHSSSSSKTSSFSNNSSSSSRSKNSLDTDLSSNIAVEARVNRKILDLEICNKSLLAFNQTLELKVREQGAEIDKLKKEIKLLSSSSPTKLTHSQDVVVEAVEPGATEEESEAQFHRLFGKLDNLIGDAKDALAFTSQVNGGRVLPSTSI